MRKEIETIRKHIKYNKYTEAFDLLQKISTESTTREDIDLLESEYNELERENRRKKLTRKEYTNEKGSIRIRLIELITEINNTLPNEGNTFENDVREFISTSLDNDSAIIENQEVLLKTQLVQFYQLQKNFSHLENLEVHIVSLSEQLDKSIIPNRQVYETRVQSWLPSHSKLAVSSIDYLISAEHIYDHISHIGSSEYSPFIHQYSRTLENEIKDLFTSFNVYLRTNKTDTEIEALATAESDNSTPNNQRHRGFAAKVKQNEVAEFKAMLDIIKKIPVATTSLFSEFKAYLNTKFDISVITNNDLIEKIDFIRINYRNKAAHPIEVSEKLDYIKAEDCKVKVREVLNIWTLAKK